MPINRKLFKITGQIVFVIVFICFSTLQAKNFEKYNKADNISDYFSGILLLNESKYDDSMKYLKKLDGLEQNHNNFSLRYIFSLVNSGNFNHAFSYSKKINQDNKGSFESDLIMGIYYLKNSKFDLSKNYFFKAKTRNSISILNQYIANSLYIWSDLNKSNLDAAQTNFNQLDKRFDNIRKIQNVFLNCYFESINTVSLYEELISNSKTDFSRYNYFYAKYLENNGKKDKAKKILEDSLKKYPRNLLLNQYKVDFDNNKKNFDFNCKTEKDNIAELLYIAANALSSQSFFRLSNFYLNLAKYLNKNFHSYDTLLAENFYKIDDFAEAKKIYKELKNYGSAFNWYSNKQISRILIQEDEKNKSLNLLSKAYDKLPNKGVYETFDYAEFLKNNEDFLNSVNYYTQILNQIEPHHPLYAEVTDGRGVAYERLGEWEKAEKDLLASLKVSPNQAYVINYLAYSWIEQGIKIKKSLEMLEKANELKANDPYIIDSLGWALFKLKRYQESKEYLQLAVRLMPADPIVNDHYGDVLWKNGYEIQARYYWKYVLNLEKTEKDLKEKVEKKLIKGL